MSDDLELHRSFNGVRLHQPGPFLMGGRTARGLVRERRGAVTQRRISAALDDPILLPSGQQAAAPT